MLAQFEAILPRVLGALYDIVACALRNERSTKPPRTIRMADAALWMKAAEPATGLAEGAFVEALERSQADRTVERTNNEPIVIALRACLESGPFEGTFGDLLERITPVINRPRFFPETAIKLSKDLDRLKTGMALAGLFFERGGKGNKGQNVHVWLEGQENEPPQKHAGLPGY